MRTNGAWYWLAAGVLALGLNGAYQDGQLGTLHCLTSRATIAMERAAERGLRLVTVAEVMLGRSPEAFGRTEAALQRVQSKMVCQRVAMAQQRIAMAQARQQIIEAEVQRKLDRVQMKMDRVRMVNIRRADLLRDCPGLSQVVVELPGMPPVDLSNLPAIQAPDFPEIPQTLESGPREPI